jgi:hypothetical protein
MRRFIKVYRPRDSSHASSSTNPDLGPTASPLSTTWDRAVGGSRGNLIRAEELIIYEDNQLLGASAKAPCILLTTTATHALLSPVQ